MFGTKQACRPDSVAAFPPLAAIPLGACIAARLFAIYPHAPRAASQRAYLMLLRVEVTAFHVHALAGAYSSLWPCSSRHRARPLAVTLLYGVRIFLTSYLARQPGLLRKCDYRCLAAAARSGRNTCASP